MTPNPDDVSPALETLLARFTDLMRKAGRRRGLAEQDLDELLQDVRIRLWRALETGEKISGVTASYVYQAARSAAVDLIRRRRAWRESPLPTGEEVSEPMVGTSIAAPQLDVLARQDVAQRLASAIESLAEARRVAVRMYLAGYPREEIAALMGWSEARTRNLLYRGLGDLRAQLSEWGIGPESAA